MKLSQLKIDPEFQSKIPPLQFEKEQQLEQNIITEGRLLNPIITWNGYILDGHTRYRILKKHGFIKFEVEEIQLANKYEALAWICKNQLGRRNLSPERKKFLPGKEYESTKLAVGGQPGNCNKVNRCDQNDHIDSEKRTCERIAVEHGVGSATVRRAEKCSRGIDAAEEAVPGAQEEILTGHIKATDEQIVALASIPKEERPAILEELKKKKSDRDDTVLERLKPSKPPPKPKPAPQKKKPTATENNTTSQAEQPETPVQAPITESPPEEEIEPTSNAPPSFLQSIQGHKRHLSEEDKARLKASVDACYKDKAAATGSIMLCKLQGATLFAIQTGNATCLTAGERLRANLVAENPDALYFVGITSNAGVEFAYDGIRAPWKIYCIETAYELYKQYGCERYVEMLHIINEAWKGNVDSYLAGVIRGVARFISVYEGEYSRERLVQQLARTHPKTITQLAQKDAGSSANRHMRQILRIYNGASREMSLPLKN